MIQMIEYYVMINWGTQTKIIENETQKTCDKFVIMTLQI